MIVREVAEADIEKWLVAKKITNSQREARKDEIDTLTDAIMDGNLVVKDDATLEHTLIHAIDKGEKKVTALNYKLRLMVKDIQTAMKGVKNNDVEGRLLAYASALTGQNTGVLQYMDTADSRIANSISVFFL